MKSFLRVVPFLLIALISLNELVLCDDGLCGIEPPKEGESCSGTPSDSEKAEETVLNYEFEEKPMTEEEKEIWDKRFYPKAYYTNHVDWPIRKELDYAEEFSSTDLNKTISLLDEIIAKQPNSPRAVYYKERMRENRLFNSSLSHTSEEFLAEINNILDSYEALMERYEKKEGPIEDYDIMPILMGSVVHHSYTVADQLNLTRRSIGILERAMKKEKDFAVSARYQTPLVQNYLALRNYGKAEEFIEKCLEQNENNVNLQFYKGVILKFTGRKKEGNKLLRSVDSERFDTITLSHDINVFASMLFNNGDEAFARLMLQEASKLHIFLSQYQRPVLVLPGKILETDPIWDVENSVGLSTYDEELSELKEFLPILKEEGLKAAANVTDDGWVVRKHSNTAMGNIVMSPEGSLATLPLFSYGKIRHAICHEIMPKTCKFFKSLFPRPTKFKLGMIKLTSLSPKTKTAPLDGLTNMRLRLLIPLQIPTGFQMLIAKDTLVPMDRIAVIDDSFEHTYMNENSSEPAVWLSVDLQHPDLTPEEVKQMSVTAYAKQAFISV